MAGLWADSKLSVDVQLTMRCAMAVPQAECMRWAGDSVARECGRMLEGSPCGWPCLQAELFHSAPQTFHFRNTVRPCDPPKPRHSAAI